MQNLVEVHGVFCKTIIARRSHSCFSSHSHCHVSQRHVGTPCGQCIRSDTARGTVFERSDKLWHQLCVFYKFRHQSDRAGQVEAPAMYLTLGRWYRNVHAARSYLHEALLLVVTEDGTSKGVHLL